MNIIKKVLLVIIVFIGMPNLALAKDVSWKVAETWPKDFPIFGEAVKAMITYVDEMSGGEFKIESVTRETHKKPLGILKLVEDGEYQMGHSASYYYKGNDINTLFFTTLPMGMIAIEQYAWFYHGGGQELMQKAYKKYGVLSFPGGNTSNQMGGWFKKEIKSLDDLKGLKMRIPGLAGDVMAALGVEATNIPPGNLLAALKSGELDALEWVGPSMDLKMGFPTAANYYYTGWHEPGTELNFMVNQEAFDSLSTKHQKILKSAMRLAAYDMYVQSYHLSAVNLSEMRQQFPEMKIRAFPTKVYRQLVKATNEELDKIAKSGNDLTREILTSIREYQTKARLWTRFSDQAYTNNAF
jgi:TRAP-type mannitol/chloroaromatic compound transport system substrate-binding protein